ncbi:16S rRNA (uracil(1498)-N(3))-methyltransferase [Moraxella oblonga]|uniref:16S rRNA (uracil(1498)-N(3))-methyltransferase n=1 Tax=Moraxella oblonga TaxID=200413 RepID=UPI00082E855E|nr:16S rRNA (uracil(1498)-N(3))-methyltransferase [Moraxella oblonga]
MRFFVEMPLNVGDEVILPDDVYHHWVKVLRANVGDVATLFNGQGGEYTTTLISMDKKGAFVQVNDFDPTNRTLPYRVTLYQAISKGDRMDYTIQKATELGVHQIQLITSERSDRLRYERDNKKLAHWQKIAISACEQCGLNIIPTILPPMSLADGVATCQDNLKIIMNLSDEHHRFDPSRLDALPTTIALLVGAEGGLSDDEIALCHRHGFLSWTIGERVLRTETAGVAGLVGLQVLGQMKW